MEFPSRRRRLVINITSAKRRDHFTETSGFSTWAANQFGS
jgi:hypothetical protein